MIENLPGHFKIKDFLLMGMENLAGIYRRVFLKDGVTDVLLLLSFDFCFWGRLFVVHGKSEIFVFYFDELGGF